MVSPVFDSILANADILLWIMNSIIITVTLLFNKGMKRIYFLVVIIGFLSITFYVEHFFASTILIIGWLLLVDLDFFVSKRVILLFFALATVLGLTNPFFYVIIYALWIVLVFTFIFGTLSLLSGKSK